MNGATGNFYTGLHEFEDMSFVLHALRSTDVFVDVGANIGSYTVLAAAVVGAQCIAFEPILETYGHLLQNVNLDGDLNRSVQHALHRPARVCDSLAFAAAVC